MKIRSIKYNFLQNLTYYVASCLFPLITYPYVTRILSPEKIGKVAFAQSFSSYFSILAICGITTYATRKVSILRDEQLELRKFVKEILLLETILSCIVFALYLTVIFSFPYFRNRQSELLLMSIGIFTGGLSSIWLYNGLEQYGSITKRFLLCKIIAVILLFLTIQDSGDYLWYAVFLLFADTLLNVIGLILIPRYVDLKGGEIGNVFVHLKGSIVFFASAVASCLYTNLDSVMLTILTNDVQTGFYATALKIKTLLVGIVLALARVLMPRLAYSLRDGKTQEVDNMVRRVVHINILASLYFSVFTVFFSDSIIKIFAGEAFSEAADALRWAVMCVPVLAVSAVFTEQLFIAQNKERSVTIMITVGAAIDLLLNGILMPSFGAAGGAAATLVTETVVLLLCLKNNGEDNRLFFPHSMLKTVLIVLAVESGLLFIAKGLLKSSILTLILTGIIYSIVYALMLVVLKDSEILSFIEYCKGRIIKSQ